MMDDPFDSLTPIGNVHPVDFRNQTASRADRKGQKARRGSKFLTASALEGVPIPERHWLVQDLIPSGTVTLLYGDGGTGKSLIALQLAAASALGRPWIGRSVSAGTAVFISAEDDQDELHRRLASVTASEEVSFADLDRLTIRSLAGEDALLAGLDTRTGILWPTDLFAEIDAFVAEVRPVVLVLDTLADLFPGNENDRTQARQFIGFLKGLAIRHECAVVLLAHPSMSGLQSGSGTSGSTGWSNSVRSRLYLSRVLHGEEEPNPDARTLTNKKANYGPTGEEIELTWRDGVFVPNAPDAGLDRMAKRHKADRVFLKLLRIFTEQGRQVNSGGGQTYAPSVFADHPEAEGVTRAALRDAMERLLHSGRVVNVESGKPSRRRSHLQEAGS